MTWNRCCPRCYRFVRPGELRCYDYRRGWLCTACEQPGDKVIPDAWMVKQWRTRSS